MEDFGFLKWIAVIAVIAYSGARQVRKNAKKGGKRRPAALDEAWPAQKQGNGFPPQSETFGADKARPQRFFGEEHDRIETPLPIEEDFATEKAQKEARRHKPDTMPASPEKAEIQPEKRQDAEFDLRQAVIMSEILKPKFDE